MRIIFSVLILMGILTATVWSRPVSYPGGITSIVTNNANEQSWLLHYSPSAKYSLGLRAEHQREGDFSIASMQLNYLLKRWNQKSSQANAYIKSGVGYAVRNSSSFSDEEALAFFSGIALDWETRRYFAGYENRYLDAGKIDDQFMQKARIGIAPYIASYGNLHTWLMLEVEHKPEGKDQFTVTPLVRVFKSVHLLEFGVSNHNDVQFNWTIRF